MMYNDYHINLGIDREVQSKTWEKGETKREYLSISCFTGNGRFKGSYKCGYVDLVTNEYVCERYDDVDAANKEYIGTIPDNISYQISAIIGRCTHIADKVKEQYLSLIHI